MVSAARPSSSGRRNTTQRLDRKAEIVHHAELLFARNGYSGTRMTDIAGAAGVTKGLLYWYFESKEALVAEILVDIRQRLRETQRAAIADIDDPLERVYLGTAASVRFITEHYRLYRLGVQRLRKLAPVLGESGSVHVRDTTRSIEEGQARGVIRTDDSAAALAYANSGVVNQLCAGAYTKRIPGTIDDIAHHAGSYVVRAIAAHPELAAAIERKHAP